MSMKKRTVKKYFHQLEKERRNPRLKRKIGLKEKMYFANLLLDADKTNPFNSLSKMLLEGGGFLGRMANSLKENKVEDGKKEIIRHDTV